MLWRRRSSPIISFGVQIGAAQLPPPLLVLLLLLLRPASAASIALGVSLARRPPSVTTPLSPPTLA